MSVADYIKNRLPYWPNWINYSLLRMNVFGDKVYGDAYRKFLKSMDEGSAERKLLDMVNYAIEHVPYYRNKYGNLCVKSKEEFEQNIGYIDKDEVMAHWNEFLVDDIDWSKVHVGTTGGTSGKPMKLVSPNNRYVHSLAFTHKQWMWFGWHYDVRGVFRNHHIRQDRDYIISPILKEIIFDTFRMNEAYAQVCWKALKRYDVRFIHAYPSSFYQFCRLCRRQGLDLHFIRAAFLASEGVTPEQRALFEEMGITIYSFYGHSEKLIMAGNCPHCEFYHIEENYGYCELVDENGKVIKETGVLGEMVGTTFCNPYFPLIRYRTGDYSEYIDNPCTGHEGRSLNGVQGRWEKNIIYKADGTYTNTAALNLHSDLYNHIDGLQYIQKEMGKLIVCLIKNEYYTATDEKALRKHFSEAMGGDEFVEIRHVNELRFQPNGKFLPLISEIKV